MALYDKQQFPARYRNGVFIEFHGSWNRPTRRRDATSYSRRSQGTRHRGSAKYLPTASQESRGRPTRASCRPRELLWGPTGRSMSRTTYADESIASIIAAPPRATPSAPCHVRAHRRPPGRWSSLPRHPMAAARTAALLVSRRVCRYRRRATREMVVLGDRIFHGQVGGATCTGCHGSNGTGSPLGPNLTDDRWFWSDGSNTGIAATIRVGVMHPKNYRAPMPPMGGAQLTADQVSAVADYVWALSQPASDAPTAHAAPPAQIAIPGEKIYPESITAAADGRIFIGSIVTRQIFLVRPGAAKAEPWIAADNQTSLGVYGVFANLTVEYLCGRASLLFRDRRRAAAQAPPRSTLTTCKAASSRLAMCCRRQTHFATTSPWLRTGQRTHGHQQHGD